MLALTWVTLRFIHFISLMLVFGFAMYGAWLAPVTIRRLLTKRFFAFTTARSRMEFDQCRSDVRRSRVG
ncbi:hypothetical protein CRG92_03605 [Escherichia sp. E2586]|nr:hypothetical protein CRG92_03605 [Escherichia sp. E2586]